MVSAHAIEKEVVNAIPEALAEHLGNRLGWPIDSEIVQTNVVGHTGADGFTRLARQAEFGGEVKAGMVYCLVDDFVGQGRTLANLRGFLIRGGEIVVGATVLTGKPYSATLPRQSSFCSNFVKNMESNSKTGGMNALASATSALQILKGITSSDPRRLTAFEIVLLRQSKAEVGQRVRELILESKETVSPARG